MVIIHVRRLSTTALRLNNVRVRFAPSPTGHLHLGGVRSALFNWLFARAHKGKFILRIEDTDQDRLISGAAEGFERDLRWLNMKPDESPLVGGEAGPYRQSDRLHHYTKYAKELLESGKAYPCYCTEKRLALVRKAAVRAKQPPKYDNRCRHLTHQEREEKIHIPHVLRFKLDDTAVEFNDVIHGGVSLDIGHNEGDPVIIKSDGWPTYHFANVVDDHMMGVSHVFRGAEWQVSTPKHILLYRALGWSAPEYGHLPLMVNTDGTKLSKRQGDITVSGFRDAGYFPESIINFILLSGGGYKHTHGHTYTMQELVDLFKVSNIRTSPSHVDMSQLPDVNRWELARVLGEPTERGVVLEQVETLVRQHFSHRLESCLHVFKYEYMMSALSWAVPRIRTLQDLITKDFDFIWVPREHIALDTIPKLPHDSHPELLMEMIIDEFHRIPVADFNNARIVSVLREMVAKQGKTWNFPMTMKFLRHILTSFKEGPGVGEIFEVLGKEGSIHRLTYTINKIFYNERGERVQIRKRTT